MNYGLWYASIGPFTQPDAAIALAQTAERVGLESIWTGEHIAVPACYQSDYPYSADGKMGGGGSVPMAEPFVWYAFVAAHTRTIKLTTGVLVLPQREPLLVAKQAATLAVLSKGRFSMGVGIGWLEEEFQTLGADFASRARRLEEYVAVMRQVWAEDQANFAGDFVNLKKVQVTPKPPQGNVPVIIGGHSPAAARRAGRIGDGFFPAKGSVEEIRQLAALARQTAEDNNRDPALLEISVSDPDLIDPGVAAQKVEQWQAAGVDRIIINPPSFDPAELNDKLEQFGEEVIRVY